MFSVLLALILLVSISEPHNAYANTIQIDSISPSVAGTISNATNTLTIPNVTVNQKTGDNLLEVGIGWKNSGSSCPSIANVTYGGTLLTQNIIKQQSSLDSAAIYTLPNSQINNGTKSVVVTFDFIGGCGVTHATVGAISFIGVNTATPVGATASITTTGSTSTLSNIITTTVTNSLIVDMQQINSPGTSPGPSSPQVQRWINTTDTNSVGGSSTKVSTSIGSTTMTWSWTNTARAVNVAIELIPSTISTPTTTTITSSLNPSKFGNLVTFTATVSPSAATGIVTFKDGTTTLGTGILSSGHTTYSTSSLTKGSHTITAAYSGDINNTASTSSPLTQTVRK